MQTVIPAAKSPCAKDCPKRHAFCGSECPEWAAYVKQRDARYDEIQKAHDTYAYIKMAQEKQRKENKRR